MYTVSRGSGVVWLLFVCLCLTKLKKAQTQKLTDFSLQSYSNLYPSPLKVEKAKNWFWLLSPIFYSLVSCVKVYTASIEGTWCRLAAFCLSGKIIFLPYCSLPSSIVMVWVCLIH